MSRFYRAITFKRVAAAIALALWIAWELVIQPIWNINIERWAEQRRIDQTLNEQSSNLPEPPMPDWLIDSISFVTGDFLIGVGAFAGLLLAWDLFSWLWKAATRRKPVDREALAEDCDDLAKIIRANRPFLGKDFACLGMIRMDIWHRISKIEKLLGRRDLQEAVFATKLDIWPDALSRLSHALRTSDQAVSEAIDGIISEFDSHRSPQGIAEKTRQ